MHVSIKIGGGIAVGECQKECFPQLVFCEEHADKATIAIVAREALKERAKLKKSLKEPLLMSFKNSEGKLVTITKAETKQARKVEKEMQEREEQIAADCMDQQD